LVQVFTVQEHRWLLWAQRVQLAGVQRRMTGPVARYSNAVTGYLTAVDSGRSALRPRASAFGLEPLYELYAPLPEPVVREREGYLSLLNNHRAFKLGDVIGDVYGFIPAPALMPRLQETSDAVLFPNKEGEAALQYSYESYEGSGGLWSGYPLLTAESLAGLRPGRYVYVTDRYWVVRVGSVPTVPQPMTHATPALLAHGDPVLAAGELLITAEPGSGLRVAEVSILSEEYFFSNRSLTLYDDVERRSDRYVAAIAHVLKGLEQAGVSTEGVLIRKF
jgi:hypothetical protein